MGLSRLCSSHCCNVHVLQISLSSETLMPAASQRIRDDAAVTVNSSSLSSLHLCSICHSLLFCRLQSLNSLIELKSASQITAQAAERLIAFQLPNGNKTGTHAFFRCHSLAIDILQDHGHTLVFALSSESSWIWYAVQWRLMRVYSHCSTNAPAKLIITGIFHVGRTYSSGGARISVEVQEQSNSYSRWSGELLSALVFRHFHSFLHPQQQKIKLSYFLFWVKNV